MDGNAKIKVIKKGDKPPAELVEIVVVAEVPARSQRDIRAEIGYMESLMMRYREPAIRIAKKIEALA
jgi:hypothetical protein